MLLSPMRYKDYIWPHNPASYSITYERLVASHKIPFGRYCMQDLGLSCRVMRGQGEFAGADAYEEFKRLATVFYGGGPASSSGSGSTDTTRSLRRCPPARSGKLPARQPARLRPPPLRPRRLGRGFL